MQISDGQISLCRFFSVALISWFGVRDSRDYYSLRTYRYVLAFASLFQLSPVAQTTTS